MIAVPVAAALIPAAVVVGGSGVLLLRARRAVAAGAMLLAGAVLSALAVGSRAMDAPDRAQLALLAGAIAALGLAVCAYPRWTWSDPVAFAAVVTVGATGVVSAVSARKADELLAISLFAVLAIFCLLWWRLERTAAADRTALLWLAVAAGSSMLVATTAAFTGETSPVGGAVAVAALAVLGPAMVIGVLRPEVVDVRGLLVHAIVFAVTLLLYVSVFSGIVAGLELGGRDRPSPGTLGVVGALLAVGFHPTTVMLRGVIDRLLFGDRPDPLRAATQVVDQIGDDPLLALRAIREALVLPYASLRADGRELAASGTAVTHTRTIPLALGEASVGEIVVGLRAGDLRLSASDEHVLRIVAPLLAQTIRARELAADLQASRGEAIAAIEEERRRLRRDLHDGLGPTLTGVAFATDAARNKLREDPSGADELLSRLRLDTADAITEIRRLVEGLRPPALDELGLIAAVAQQTRHMHTAAGSPLVVTMEAPDPMPALPAAVEVAAYRIVIEALTNVARHASCERAQVVLTVDQVGLQIRVEDPGQGDKPWRAGVGMASMRERAEQVGGSLTAEARPDGGRVQATIPLA